MLWLGYRGLSHRLYMVYMVHMEVVTASVGVIADTKSMMAFLVIML